MPYAKHGFTLIEMAFVLAIIALVAGGILVGRSLVRDAELRTIITDVDRYKKSIDLFNYSCCIHLA